ncbi:MAG: hypothetical protein JSW61_07990 [Candidatus Thorarchaeota archaeon]|nr:MAG: hypothetical protein JSW61_07990 [Candidatus Thorarchaeota archaeon]
MQIDLTAVSSILGLASVIIGIIATLNTIRRFTRARRLGIFLEFHRLLYDKEFIKDMNEVQTYSYSSVEDFFAKYGPEANPDSFAKFTRVGSYFDGLSTLVRKRFIEIDFMPETTAIALIGFWEKFAHKADEFAIVYRRPGCWNNIKHVYERLHKLDHEYPHTHESA